MSYKKILSILFIAFLIFAGCQQNNQREMPPTNEQNADTTNMHNTAVAIISPTQGNTAHGKVTFTKVEGGIHIVADIMGLAPGKHGFHVHEKGDCSAPDGTSAGGHFAPLGHKHGAPSDTSSHVGDMGNIEAGKDSTAHFEWTSSLMSFEGNTSIIGKAVIVHGGEDDLKSQPSGNAGPRVGCGVIVWENSNERPMKKTGTEM